MTKILLFFSVFVLSVASSSLSLVKYLNTNEIYILIFTISGYLQGLVLTSGIIAWKYTSLSISLLKAHYVLSCAFRFVTSIIFVVFAVRSSKKTLKEITTAIIVLIFLEVLLTAFSVYALVKNMFGHPKENYSDEEMANSGSSLETIRNTLDTCKPGKEVNEVRNTSAFLIKKDHNIQNRTSQITLVEKPVEKPTSIEPLEETSEIDYIISTIDSRKFSQDESHYDCTQNWMDSGAKLNSLDFSTDLNTMEREVELTKKPSIRIFNTRRSIKRNATLNSKKSMKRSYSITNTSGVSSNEKSYELKYEPKLNEYTSMPDLKEVDSTTPSFKSPESNDFDINVVRHIPEEVMEVKVYEEDNTSIMIRSGSESADELQLRCIKGRAPVVNKEKSCTMTDASGSITYYEEKKAAKLISPVDETKKADTTDTSDTIKDPSVDKCASSRGSDKIDRLDSESAMIDMKVRNSNSRKSSIEIDLEDDRSFNLPYGDEFSEPIDQTLFDKFDQTYAIYPMSSQKVVKPVNSKRSLSCTDFENSAMSQHKKDEDYRNTLVGLEKIPKVSFTNDLGWAFKEKRVISNSMVNHITPQNWNENAISWNEKKERSGVNSSILGISKAATYSSLRQFPSEDKKTVGYLLPPIDNLADNIDSLSDLEGSNTSFANSGNIYEQSKLSRSYSAPSLHTFRDVSNGSKKSTVLSMSDLFSNGISLEEEYQHETNYPPDLVQGSPEMPNEPSSPIKKFFQESPKKLNNALRRRTNTSRYSLDAKASDPLQERTAYGHRHTQSAVSNSQSIASGISSRSNSPRKSLKSILTSKSYTFQKHSRKSSVKDIPKNIKQGPPAQYLLHQFEQCSRINGNKPDFWDIYTTPSSDKSRVSSVPSAVIGEYDREKWRTLKDLESQGQLEQELSH